MWLRGVWANLNPKAEVIEVWTATVHKSNGDVSKDIVTLNFNGWADRVSVPEIGKYAYGMKVRIKPLYRQSGRPCPKILVS